MAELQERMSSAEFSEWVAFASLEPFGFEADFLGHAQTAAVIAAVNRGKDTPPPKVTDFMPKQRKNQSADEMLQLAAMFTAAFSGEGEGE